jgi:hypothetical protein
VSEKSSIFRILSEAQKTQTALANEEEKVLLVNESEEEDFVEEAEELSEAKKKGKKKPVEKKVEKEEEVEEEEVMEEVEIDEDAEEISEEEFIADAKMLHDLWEENEMPTVTLIEAADDWANVIDGEELPETGAFVTADIDEDDEMLIVNISKEGATEEELQEAAEEFINSDLYEFFLESYADDMEDVVFESIGDGEISLSIDINGILQNPEGYLTESYMDIIGQIGNGVPINEAWVKAKTVVKRLKSGALKLKRIAGHVKKVLTGKAKLARKKAGKWLAKHAKRFRRLIAKSKMFGKKRNKNYSVKKEGIELDVTRARQETYESAVNENSLSAHDRQVIEGMLNQYQAPAAIFEAFRMGDYTRVANYIQEAKRTKE